MISLVALFNTALLAGSKLQSDQQSVTEGGSSTRKIPELTNSEGPSVLRRPGIDFDTHTNMSPVPKGIEMSPGSIVDDLNSSGGGPGSPSVDNLKKYIESQNTDINWLIGDKAPKRDNSFEEEVKTCRKQFLIETLTDFILNELLTELKSELLYFRRVVPAEGQQISLQMLEDPRYVTESSDEETIYGIRTNMNAVFEYCNLLVRFILDNYLDLLLEKFNMKKVHRPQEVLAEIREREVLLGLAGQQWKEVGTLNLCKKSKDQFFPEFIFESLEQEIIVNHGHLEQLQQHEHHAESL